ncbi:MAG: hypothetical protein RR620_08430 [Clostridium sp.]
MNYFEVSDMCNDINIKEWSKFIKNKKIIDDSNVDSLLKSYISNIKSLLKNEDNKIFLLDPNIFALKDNCCGSICECGSSNIIVKVGVLSDADKDYTVFIPGIDNFIHESSLKDLPQLRVPIDIRYLERYKWCCVDCATFEWHDFSYNESNTLMYNK